MYKSYSVSESNVLEDYNNCTRCITVQSCTMVIYISIQCEKLLLKQRELICQISSKAVLKGTVHPKRKSKFVAGELF